MNAQKPILDSYFWELFQGKGLWGGGVRTRQYFKQTVSSIKRTKPWLQCGRDFSVLGNMLPNSSSSPPTRNSWWNAQRNGELSLLACLACAATHIQPSLCVCVCEREHRLLECFWSWPVMYLTAMIYLFPWTSLCVGRGWQFATILFHISLFIFSSLC